jgi:hypothetical protein
VLQILSDQGLWSGIEGPAFPFAALDIWLGSHICLGAGGQLTDTLPVLPGICSVALQAANIAPLEQRWDGGRSLRERLLDIVPRWIETIEIPICASAVNPRVRSCCSLRRATGAETSD